MKTLDDLNHLTQADFVDALGGVFEHAPWVAAAAAGRRPFATVAALHEAMMQAVREAADADQLAFLRGHPELAGNAARQGALTTDSTAEQAGLGLATLDDDETVRIGRMNATYRARFGFPFILCVRRHTRASVLERFGRRLERAAPQERDAAMTEIGFITRLRLVALVEGPGAPVTTGSLTTHVLDTAIGRPAAEVAVTLCEIGGRAPVELARGITDADGRTAPLLAGAPLRIGRYELVFDLRGRFAASGTPPFLDTIPVRFAIAEPETHYHVPLLVSPGGYTTYRGS